MAVITSVTGDVAFANDNITFVNLREVTKWSWSAKVNKHEYASNFTGGIRRSLRGTKSASGSINGVYDPFNPIQFQINEDQDGIMRFFFIGTSTDSTGVSNPLGGTGGIAGVGALTGAVRPGEIVGGHYIQCPVLINKLDYNIDIDNGNIVDWSVDWDANGTWTYPIALAPLVAQAARGPISSSSLRGVADMLGTDDEEEMDNIRNVAHLVARMLRDNPGQARASQAMQAV